MPDLRPLPRASSLQAERGMSVSGHKFRPTSSKIFGMGMPSPLPPRRMSGATVRTARSVARISRAMRVGKPPSKWRRGFEQAKNSLKRNATLQAMIRRKRSARVLSLGDSRIEVKSTRPTTARSETLAPPSNRQSATPSNTKALPSQNGRATYTLHYGQNASLASLPRNTLRFSHPVVDAMIPGLPTPAAMTTVPQTPADEVDPPSIYSKSSQAQTVSHWSKTTAGTTGTATSSMFDGQIKPTKVADTHVRNSTMVLTVPQALNQVDGVPRNLQDKVELPRSVTRRATKRSAYYENHSYRENARETGTGSLYLAKPLPFDARGLTNDLENCEGETVSADAARQNALEALESRPVPSAEPGAPAPESPLPSLASKADRRELAAASLYLAKPQPFDTNRLTQDLENCNGQGVPSQYERRNALQALEGSGGLPARKDSDLGPLLEKYAADARKRRGTQYPGKAAYGEKRYTAFHPSMMPEPLRTPQKSEHVLSPTAEAFTPTNGKKPADRTVEQNLEKSRKREISAQDLAQPIRKSRLDRSLPPSPPSTVWRESVVPDLDMNFLRPRPAPPVPSIKRKPLATSKVSEAPVPAAPLPVPPPTGPPSYQQMYMYQELARLHKEQSRVMRSYAENLAMGLSPQQQQPQQQPQQPWSEQNYAQQQYPQQQFGSLGWKKTMKKVIMKDW